MALTNEEVQRELQDMKTKVYLPSSYNEVAARFAELVTNHLNDDTRDAFFGEFLPFRLLLFHRRHEAAGP